MVEDEQLTQTELQDEQIENAILNETKDMAQKTTEKSIDLVKNTADKATRDLRDAAKKAAKEASKKTIKALGKVITSAFAAILPYVLIISIVIAFFAGIAYFLEIETAKDMTDNIYKSMNIVEDEGDIANIVEIVADDKGYHLEFVEGFDKKLEEAIKNLNKENKSIDLSNKETLKKFIMAEVKTKFPYLQGEDDGENKFQGSIVIKRYTPNKNIGALGEASAKEPITLKYVDENVFQSYINNGDSQALNVYTLDENKNLLTATWSYSSDTGTVMQANSPMDYRSATARYTMPFEYPLFFLIDSDCEDFCTSLAQLAMDSTMEIAIIDNVTDTKTVTTVETTTNETRDIYDVKDGKQIYKNSETSSSTTTSSTEVITESVYTNIQVANVKSWATKKDCEISLNSSTQAGTPVTTHSSSPGINHQLVKETDKKREYLVTGQSIATTITTESYQNSYDVTDSEVEENTDDFVKIYEENKDKLNNNMIPDWLFEIMEENPKTVNMIDLTRYLLYKATGKNYGVTNFDDIDFSAYLELEDVGCMSSTISPYGISLTREEFIKAVESYKAGNSDYYERMVPYAADFYDVCKQYNINPAFVFAHACLETGYGGSAICKDKNNYFGMGAYNDSPYSSATSYSSPRESIKAYCEWIKTNSTPGQGNYKMANDRGAEFATVNPLFAGNPSNNIYVLYDCYAVSDNYNSQTIAERAAYAEQTTNQRIEIAKTIFGSNAFPIVESSVSGNILSEAEKMMQYMIDKKYAYVQGNYVPLETNESKKGYQVDCSSFVCWVLYRCGYTDASSGGWQLNTDSLPPYLERKGFKKITSLGSMEAGDIVFFPGHVQIYAGKNSSGTRQYVNAGNAPKDNSSIYQTYEPSFLYAYRAPSVSKGNETNESGNGYTKVYTSGNKKYKLYEQWASNWANNMYASWGTMQNKGCGPSAAAIVLSGYGVNCTPMTIVNECTSITNQYGAGTLEAVKGYLEKYGLNVTMKGSYGTNVNSSQKNEILNHLRKGKPVVVLMRGNLTLSNGGSYHYDGHYITLLGINEKNEVYVGDPGSWTTDGYTTIDRISNLQVYYLINN